MYRVSLLLLALGMTSVVTLGGPIDGKWTAEVQGRNGTQTQTLRLKFDGAKLTGTLDSGRGGATEITEGKLTGMDVSFKAARTGRNGSTTTSYAGKLSGDELKLTAPRDGGAGGKGGGPQELDFKRAK